MLSLTFLGTGASIPTIDRNVAGLAVQREGETILFDCGEGNQRQMMRYGVGFTFKEIFFTHYHADHLLGITGLLRTMGLQDRTSPVTLYGPKGAQRILSAAISLGIERNKFPVEIHGGQAGRPAGTARSTTSSCSRPSIGPIPWDMRWSSTCGWAGSIPTRARELGIPEGPLWGRLHKGETVTLPDGRTVGPADLVGEPRDGRTLVYSGDTRPHLSVIEAAKGADLLVHEATFGSDELERARETGHSTAAEAARVALEAGVRRLVLTHISSRYNRDASELLAEARAVFPETVIARDGMTVDVPYADAVDSVPDAPR